MCGDGSCDSACGESQSSCPRDCGYSTDQIGNNNNQHGNGYRNYNQSNASNSSCSQAPNPNAGSDKDVYGDGSVRLEGTAAGKYDRVTWTCTGGVLSNNSSLQPTWYYGTNDYNGDNSYSRTYTCTMTAYNNCGSKSDSMVIRTGYNQHNGISQYSNDGSGANMKVALIANPASGCGAAYGVDLTATVTNYGSYKGGYTYYFDCNNDGTWEKIANTSDSNYDAYNLCNYAGVGSYTARVRVETQGRTLTDTEIIHTNNCGNSRAYPYPSAPVYPVVPCPTYPVVIAGPTAASSQVGIQKTVSNLSDGTQYLASVQAQPLEVLSYKIILTGGSSYSTNVIVRDALPAGITAARDLRVDGISNGGDIQSGINVGNLSAGQTRIITYTATVAVQGSLGYGQTTITNAASVYADGGQSASASAMVYVSRAGIAGATGVSTGFDGNFFARLVLLAAAFGIGLFMLIKEVSGRRKMEIVTGGFRRVKFAS
jgi:hypothetical protein